VSNPDLGDVFSQAIGKIIVEIYLGNDDALHFTFADDTRMKLADEGQSCCENRYMRTDDKLSEFIGSKLLCAVVKDAPNMPGEDCEHEVQFLEIQTSIGVFTMASHNEHSGYYGGFVLEASTRV
jgi:hypothetical protein